MAEETVNRMQEKNSGRTTRRFGEYTDSVTMHEQVSDCLQSEYTKVKKKKGGDKVWRLFSFVVKRSSRARVRSMLKK
jgi:hypothetical protein